MFRMSSKTGESYGYNRKESAAILLRIPTERTHRKSCCTKEVNQELSPDGASEPDAVNSSCRGRIAKGYEVSGDGTRLDKYPAIGSVSNVKPRLFVHPEGGGSANEERQSSMLKEDQSMLMKSE